MSDEALARLEELLVDRALVGLSSLEQLELERLLAEAEPGAALDFELAAAELDLALDPSLRRAAVAPLPESLRTKLVAGARHYVPVARAPRRAPPSPRPAPGERFFAVAGWLVAAAALLFALLDVRAPDAARDPERVRTELLARADTLHLDWSATDPASHAHGDVIWSQELQQGVMHLQDLAPNDPTHAQFQLWIFDESQEHPIDGGVFDIGADDALVSIEAKLHVGKPTLFAVTLEKPGGVVVSDQKRIVLVAKI